MMEKTQRPGYSPEVRERAVRMVAEHVREYASQWACIVSIAAKVGCSAQALHNWVALGVIELRGVARRLAVDKPAGDLAGAEPAEARALAGASAVRGDRPRSAFLLPRRRGI